MIVVRRVYILAVCAISLQSVVWAIIALLRNLLVGELNATKSSIAMQTAVIIVGLPIFLVHWLWAQRLATDSAEERTAGLRRIYLVGVMAAFVVPFAASAFSLLHAILRQLLGVTPLLFYPVNSLAAGALYYGVSMLVLAIFWFYQRHVLQQDRARQPEGETDVQALVQRLYSYVFSAVGLVLVVAALIPLLRWLLFQFGDAPARYWTTNRVLAAEWTRLLVGLTLWLVHWLGAQRLFATGAARERESVVRKFYLYVIVFVGTVAAVASASAILAGILSRILRAPSSGDVREALSVLLVAGGAWAYHAVVLHRDARQSVEQPQQAGIRRLYRYLVAGVGLVALLLGVGGVISILFFTLDGEPFIGGVRQALAWFISAIIAGLLVWLFPWRQIQTGAAAEGAMGAAERQSLVRKIYLYTFIFVATMTVLGTAVYLVSQLVELLIGSRSSAHLLRDLGMAFSYSLIAVAIWLYHGLILRSDGRAADQEQRVGLANLRVAIVGGGQPALMERLLQGLQQKLPGVQWTAPLFGVAEEETAVLAQANVIISPAKLAYHEGQTELAAAVANSPAYKLLIPISEPDCLWLGLQEEDEATFVRLAAQAIEKIAAGETARPGGGLLQRAIVGLIAGVFLLVIFLATLVRLIGVNLF